MYLYIDLDKALDTSKLVRKPVEVHGSNGKVFTRMQWVDPNTGQPVSESGKAPEAPSQGKAESKTSFHDLNHPKLALEHTDHKLPDHEVEYRMGKKGDLDLSKLTQGTPVTEVDSVWYEEDHKALFTSIFGNVTKQGLEHVFGDPKNGKFKAVLDLVDAYKDKDGNRMCELSFLLRDADEEHIGHVNRSVYRDKDGVLNVKNVELVLKSEHQGSGIANTLYKNTEQYWRHLSGGNPLNIHILANISIGTYAWAKKGFSFASKQELKNAREEFKEFWASNGKDYRKVLEDCGVSDLNDITEPWEFAMLDDGNTYDISRLIDPESDNAQYKSEIKDTRATVGKAFMLGGKSAWSGIKRLNQDHASGVVSNHFNRKVGV